MEGERPDRPHEQDLTDPVWDTTVRCWQEDPVLRPRMKEVAAILREWCIFLSLCTVWKPQHTSIPAVTGYLFQLRNDRHPRGHPFFLVRGMSIAPSPALQLERSIPAKKNPFPPDSGCALKPSGLPRAWQILLTNSESLILLEGKQQNFREEFHCGV